jgi:hypothetical protein
LATHTTASNIEHLITFYELTGDTRFLARVPEAIDWLDKVKLAKPDAGGRTHPTFIELQTNRPLYVHRRGSNVVNGEYYVDYDAKKGIGHYSPTRRIDTAALRKSYDAARNADAQALAKKSPLAAGTGVVQLPRFFADRYAPPAKQALDEQLRKTLTSLNATGYWPALLPQTSYPYKAPEKGPRKPGDVPGDFSGTHVGDESDTSPFTDTARTEAISTAEYLRNMNILIAWLTQAAG